MEPLHPHRITNLIPPILSFANASFTTTSSSPSSSSYFWGENEHSVVPHDQFTFTFQPRYPLAFSFCEEKYVVMPYIAEFMNTFTSLAYIAFALRSYYTNRSTWKLCLAYSIVGLASTWNHATLKYNAQVVDQISMHIFAVALLYYSISTALSPSRAVINPRSLLASFVLILETSNVVYFLNFHNTDLHQQSFAGACALSAVVLGWRAERVDNKHLKRRLRRLYISGIGLFLLAYSLWLLDFKTCSSMREVRHYFGMPIAWLLELHAWWHVLTALAGFNYIQLIEAMSQAEKGIARNKEWVGCRSQESSSGGDRTDDLERYV